MLDFAGRHGWDEAHCRRVTALALSLFGQTAALHGLDADHFQVVEAATVVDRGDHARLELRARDTPDLAMWAAEGNGDLFELEFGRRVQPVAVEVTQPAGRSLAGRRAGVATAVHVRRRGR